MPVLFVTGTGTEVGKTAVTAALAALGLERGSVRVIKPGQTGVAPGEPGDLAVVSALAPGVVTQELVRYPDPLSPAAAARLSGLAPLDPAAVYDAVLAAREDLVLVEGAGGLLVRFDEEGTTLADLARGLQAPVLVVSGPHLGTLNATALTLEALAHRGVALEGVVLGSWPAEPGLAERSNLRDLETLAARPLLGALPTGAPWAVPPTAFPPGTGVLGDGVPAPATTGDGVRASAAPGDGVRAFVDVARDALGPQLGGTWSAREFRRRWDPVP